MTITLITRTSKGLPLTSLDMDTNWTVIQDTLNNTITPLSGLVSRLSTLEQTVKTLTARLSADEGNLTLATEGIANNNILLSTHSAQISTLQNSMSLSAINTIQTNVSNITASINAINTSLTSKVSSSAFNSQVSSINSTLLTKADIAYVDSAISKL